MNPETPSASVPRIVSGIPLSDGRGEGRIFHVRGGIAKRAHRTHTIPDDQIASETGRMRQAIQLVSLVLENSIRQVTQSLGESYAAMFVALREILHDPSLMVVITEQIESLHHDAGSAVATVFTSFRERLSNAPSPYLRERANDLMELQESVLDALANSDALADTTKSRRRDKGKTGTTIAVVETLSPRLVLELNASRVSGIACERSGPTSHAAILCRAFGIPAIEGIKSILGQLHEGEYAMLDGARGTIGVADRRAAVARIFCSGVQPGMTHEKNLDLSQITLMANLNFARNAITALAAGAQGIGLYRTEFEFLIANRLLTKQEQFLRYRNVVIAMMGLPVTIRLLDIAADKSSDIFAAFGGQIDPACSGAQFLLSWPELLETQAGAIAQTASFGPVMVLYPMVADAEQFLRLKSVFCNAVPEITTERLQHGAMIELPSAVDTVTDIFEQADFACLGTNDLTKHLLDVDRETAVAHGAEIVRSPKLWDAIGRVAAASVTQGKNLTVCGEMASDLRLLPRFIDLGLKTFSMDIRKIRRLRKRNTDQVTDAPRTQ